jgi:hypothetical protein
VVESRIDASHDALGATLDLRPYELVEMRHETLRIVGRSGVVSGKLT